MTLGLSVPGQSLLHRLPAGAKMAALLVASLALFLTNSLVVVLASVPVGFAVYLSTGVPLKGLIADLRGPAVIIVAILVFQCLFGSPAEGVLAAARFATLILIAGAVTLSTPVSAMAELVEWLLRPLRPIGINPEKIGLAIALAIRFVPMITQEFHLVREAQSARGLGRNPVALVVPLVIRTLKAADELADAIEARGYDA